jgi:hypothetical protein
MASTNGKSGVNLLEIFPETSGTLTLEEYTRSILGLVSVEAEIAVEAIAVVVQATTPDTRQYPTDGWKDRAICRDKPLSFFSPGRGGTLAGDAIRAFCGACPVREDCLLDYFQDPSKISEVTFWRAGKSQRELHRLKKTCLAEHPKV